MKNLIKSTLTLIIMFSTFCSYGQDVLRVASKEEQKTFKFEKGDTLKVNAEKAHLIIEKWENSYLEITVTKFSKHQDGRTAVKEIDYLHYTLEKTGNVVHFTNYFLSSDEYKKVKGLLSVSLTVKAPESLALDIQNRFGSITISHLSSHISLSNRFVETSIQECKGELHLTAFFGSNQVEEFKGDLIFELERSELSLNRMIGAIKGTSQFGMISLSNLNLSGLSVDSKHSEIELKLESALSAYNYNLKTTFNKIFIKGEKETAYKNEWIKNHSGSLPTINVKTTYSPITILTRTHE